VNRAQSRKLTLRHFDVTEEITNRLAERLQATLEAVAPELLKTSTVDHVSSHAGSYVPHMLECDQGKLAAPAHGQGKAAAESEELVAASLAAVEAEVGVLPHAVDGVGAFRLAEDILELDLDVIVEIIGIPVHHINIRHSCC